MFEVRKMANGFIVSTEASFYSMDQSMRTPIEKISNELGLNICWLLTLVEALVEQFDDQRFLTI